MLQSSSPASLVELKVAAELFSLVAVVLQRSSCGDLCPIVFNRGGTSVVYFLMDITGPHFDHLQPEFTGYFVPDDGDEADEVGDLESVIDVSHSDGSDVDSLDGADDGGPCDSSEESVVYDSDPEDAAVPPRRYVVQCPGVSIGSTLTRPIRCDPMPRT